MTNQRGKMSYGEIAVVIIAVCALSISIYQAYLMRDNARRQLMPLLSYEYKINSQNPDEPIVIQVSNSGLGSAKIKALKIDGILYSSHENEKINRAVEKRLEKFFDENIENSGKYKIKLIGLDPGFWLMPEKMYTIIEIEQKWLKRNYDPDELYNEGIGAIDIEIEFYDIFDNIQPSAKNFN